jgi:hypothetical protein
MKSGLKFTLARFYPVIPSQIEGILPLVLVAARGHAMITAQMRKDKFTICKEASEE